ncbi:MAG: D-beta-D-heptose 1-phosphate adenylyltransferase [Alphaproteobacteria bacterium MarineAlpha5_Bin8]|nr:MAG: D-beta-D-heptose 1-phosphate adenylyltransferase [Alphaproteobacteria bacterium MarineAlpha5_Bin8]PPR54555.1 MAG: D-beta-D-heptose 1-phosphate adenylyltransferase [Alphaproteobacteria bacterium MarineAlpha5_Bin6]|tara:strand:- start:43 stop:1581 length:1539 start_codon:yes stop_codon:yes gene_type:complete
MNSDFFDKYKHKIKNINELLKIIGSRPRKNKTILCHGVFDVVHPGHVRHLAYAKTKAKILIVSITADKHIKKGTYRPHVPQQIRALNLAAFEMVDYVIIDSNSKPLINIEKIKPDFFAKGFEYTSSKLPPATKEESNIVKKYGGKMIFTPGDVVYSSSNFLDLSLPKINIEKLVSLMSLNKITFKDLKKDINNLNKIKVHVVGDTIIDTYTRTTLIGGPTKTPTVSVLYNSKKNFVGGAGIVSKHLSAAGAKVSFSTLLGEDVLKKFVLTDLKKNKIKVLPIIDPARPTTNKNVVIADGYRLLKIDKLDNQPISEEILNIFIKQIKKTKADIIVFSDFRHGIFNKRSINSLNNSIKKNIFKVADSQVATRWGNICDFKNFDLITPNEKETRFSLSDQDSSISDLSRQLSKSSKFKNLILKLGARGVLCVNNGRGFSIPSFTNNVVDSVGSGDALLSYASLILYKTKSLIKAAIIGSMAAACECEIDGNKTIAPSLLKSKIDEIERTSNYKQG